MKDGYRSDVIRAGTIFNPEGRVRSTETLLNICQTTRCHKPEDQDTKLKH